MTKKELMKKLEEKVKNEGLKLTKKEIESVFTLSIETIKDALIQEEKIQLIGFGTFDIVERSPRKGHNLTTGEEIIIPASKSVKFKQAKTLKEELNK